MRDCVWCEADISAVGAAKPIMYARWGGPDDNWQCLDSRACDARLARLDIKFGLDPHRYDRCGGNPVAELEASHG